MPLAVASLSSASGGGGREGAEEHPIAKATSTGATGEGETTTSAFSAGNDEWEECWNDTNDSKSDEKGERHPSAAERRRSLFTQDDSLRRGAHASSIDASALVAPVSPRVSPFSPWAPVGGFERLRFEVTAHRVGGESEQRL